MFRFIVTRRSSRLKALHFGGRLAAYRAIGSHVQNAFTVPCNRGDPGPRLLDQLDQLDRFTFEFVRETPCLRRYLLLNISCH